jgi:murein DD-endopeptidase MepM/ murein hydrolase activator NlpD
VFALVASFVLGVNSFTLESIPPAAAIPLAAANFGAPTSAPAYYKAIIVAGKAFPLARSTFLSFIEIFDDWHAPRLRLVNGTWLLIGVHEGIDIAVEPGTPVLAMEPGTVENTGWTFYSGRRVGVRGVDGRYYFYAHLSVIAAGIAPGAPVAAGSVLGLAGNTGYGEPGHRDEFPPHLHFGIEDGAEWVNPYPTLVSLYEATVKGDRRAQAALDGLLAAGETAAWSRLAESTYLDLGA